MLLGRFVSINFNSIPENNQHITTLQNLLDINASKFTSTDIQLT